jgi:tRNA 2-thiouridine synthesizing protein A
MSEIFMKRGFKVEHFIDSLGEMCPIPIIKAEKKLKTLKSGEKVVLETDHSCSIQSVTGHFVKKYGYICNIVEVEEGVWQIEITKK